MYNGTIDIDNLDKNEILELLEACDELCFDELTEDLQNFLIREEKWIQQNLIHTHKISSKHQLFNLLQDYCNKMICENPEIVLNSNNIATIEKSMIVSILKRDDLEMDEIDIWNYIIQWGSGQNKELRNKNISEWKKDNFKKLKYVLDDIIPLIRFNEISRENFYDKVNPYKKIFDKNTYEKLLQYYFTEKWQPELPFQKGPRIGKGKGGLLNVKTKSLISSWINQENNNYNINNMPYNFELIYCGSQDGYARSIFEQKCYNIEQTIVMMKIKETGELVGGYNPVCWNLKEKSPNSFYYIETDKSFIFKIDENQPDDSVLSKVKNPKYAIHHYEQNVNITHDYTKFHEITISFVTLALNISVNNEPYCYYGHISSCYENNLKLRNNNKAVHLLEECEIYKIVKKN